MIKKEPQMTKKYLFDYMKYLFIALMLTILPIVGIFTTKPLLTRAFTYLDAYLLGKERPPASSSIKKYIFLVAYLFAVSVTLAWGFFTYLILSI